MKKEYAKIEIYRSPDGQPTCALKWDGYLCCPILGSRCFGSRYICMANQAGVFRDNDGIGYIRPHENCILWQGKK